MSAINEEFEGRTEDIDLDVLPIIETSYGIQFRENELKGVRTFGELCNIILSKITYQDTNDCTSQQAFYKLREAIVISCNIDKDTIKIDTPLAPLFPKDGRKKKINAIEKQLGFKLKILSPKGFIAGILAITLVLSFLGIFIALAFKLFHISMYALFTFIGSIFLMKIANLLGREFDVSTVGELAEKMTMEHYLASRRNTTTINKSEVVKNIEKLFISKLCLDMKEIKPETIIA